MNRMFLINGILFIVTFLCHFSSPQNGLIGVNAKGKENKRSNEKGNGNGKGKKIRFTEGDLMNIKKVVIFF